MNLNFYNILKSNINDSQSIIKKKYYKLCKKYHPDKNNNKSSNHIKKINLAYEVLGDPDKRAKYNIYILKKQKSNIDHLNMLFIIYNTLTNDILKILLKQSITHYLTIKQSINVKFQDFYNGAKQKVRIITKNYNDHTLDSDIEFYFKLDNNSFTFEQKGDIFQNFQGNVHITINIDYTDYQQFQIINNKLFCQCSQNNNFIELPNNDILDITNAKWSNSKLGIICTIPNYGLLQNYRRDYLTLYKN
jgi:curved DNA-binding protein CbpA